jgi:hypothetical protein
MVESPDLVFRRASLLQTGPQSFFFKKAAGGFPGALDEK